MQMLVSLTLFVHLHMPWNGMTGMTSTHEMRQVEGVQIVVTLL